MHSELVAGVGGVGWGEGCLGMRVCVCVYEYVCVRVGVYVVVVWWGGSGVGGSLVVRGDGGGMGSWWGMIKRITSKTHLKLMN
jgi:hypothetical protein